MWDKRKTVGTLSLALALASAYRLRHQIISRGIGLPPPRYQVRVTRNLRIPMLDGIHLLADLYSPVTTEKCPTILIRTPYGRRLGADMMGMFAIFVGHRFAEQGFHVLIQDVRGRFDSEGEFEPFVNERVDGLATLAWIETQPWFNGAIGMWGPSYLGYVQWAVAANSPPSLKAIMPMVVGSNGYSVVHADGSFGLESLLRWIYLLDSAGSQTRPSFRKVTRRLTVAQQEKWLARGFWHLPLKDADRAIIGEHIPYFQTWLHQTCPNDPYWQLTDLRENINNVQVPVHLLSGWYDFALRELLADYMRLRQNGRSPYLTIGPWAHSDTGHVVAGLQHGLRWFNAHLKGIPDATRQKPVQIYVMGADEWRWFGDWPPAHRPFPLFLHSNHKLTPQMPADFEPPDVYLYDPANPTPSLGGTMLGPRGGVVDGRELEFRPDVLVYSTPPLEKDVEVIGPVKLVLYVKSSVSNTDFYGRLCDVWPDGRSLNVCDGLHRLRVGETAVQPDGSCRIEIDLWATAYRFRAGHCLRLYVASSAHPRWARNLGTDEPLATATRIVTARQTVFHDAKRPSALILPLFQGEL